MDYMQIVENCISFIEGSLKHGVTVEAVLSQTHYSYPHFCKIFTDIVGDSVTGYIRKRKLSGAAQDLVTSKKTIVDIALDYGFGSQQTFTRAFTNMFQISPQKYRENGMLDDLYKAFKFPAPGSVPGSSLSISIEALPAMKMASFHAYNGGISFKNPSEQQDKVVSKAWGGLIKWQMSYEYQKRCGRTGKLPNTASLGKFFVDNRLHVSPNTRYWGFSNPFPFDDTEYGYEAWAMLGNYLEGEPVFLEDSGVQIKAFSGGLYAVAEAAYGQNSNLDQTWKMLHRWVAENQQYEYGEHQWLEEHLTKPDEGGFHSFKLFLPIKQVDLLVF